MTIAQSVQSVAVSVAANGALAFAFVLLNQWALAQQLEETFVTLAVYYGALTVGVNAALAAAQRR